VTSPRDAFGFDALQLEWLAAKPGAKWGQRPDVLNLWVADMDFPPPPAVSASLQRLIEVGDLGYPAWALEHSPALDAFATRAATRYGWQLDVADCRELNDVTQGIQIALEHHTVPGEGVVVLQPSYPPFLKTVEQMRRAMVPLNGRRSTESPTGWVFDWDELDHRLSSTAASALLLCHPHNPTGHVFDDVELRRIAALADRHDLLIISDEIHADLTFAPRRHLPMALFAPTRTVSIHAASKAFNLAGLRYAVIHFGPSDLRDRVNGVANHLYGEPNLFGAAAAHAAWTEGDEWLDAVLEHLGRQRHLAVELVREALPTAVATVPASTYLLWIDCTALGLGDDPSEVFLRRGVRLSEGPDFGMLGVGHTRLNFATSTEVLRAAVTRMATAPAS
jgi:cystathionine beta-lyase